MVGLLGTRKEWRRQTERRDAERQMKSRVSHRNKTITIMLWDICESKRILKMLQECKKRQFKYMLLKIILCFSVHVLEVLQALQF